MWHDITHDVRTNARRKRQNGMADETAQSGAKRGVNKSVIN
jgi:hypothetical protein